MLCGIYGIQVHGCSFETKAVASLRLRLSKDSTFFTASRLLLWQVRSEMARAEVNVGEPPVLRGELMFSVESADDHFVDGLEKTFAAIPNSYTFNREK